MNNQNNRSRQPDSDSDPMDNPIDGEWEPVEGDEDNNGGPARKPTGGSGISMFGDFDTAAAEDHAAQAEKDRGAGKFLKLPEGKSVIRFMPPAKGERVPFKTVWEHNIDLPGGKVSFACPRNNHKLACPACQQEASLMAQGLDARAKGFKAKKRHYANVIVRGEEDLGPRIFGFGYTIEEDLISYRRDMDVNFSHPITGTDILVIRKGTTATNTEYKTTLDPKGPRPLAESDAQLQELADAMHDLNTVVRSKTAPEIIELLQGGGSNQNSNQGGGNRQVSGGNAAGQLRGNNPRR